MDTSYWFYVSKQLRQWSSASLKVSPCPVGSSRRLLLFQSSSTIFSGVLTRLDNAWLVSGPLAGLLKWCCSTYSRTFLTNTHALHFALLLHENSLRCLYLWSESKSTMAKDPWIDVFTVMRCCAQTPLDAADTDGLLSSRGCDCWRLCATIITFHLNGSLYNRTISLSEKHVSFSRSPSLL